MNWSLIAFALWIVYVFITKSLCFHVVHACKYCHKNAHCVLDHCVCDEGYEGNGEQCTSKSDQTKEFAAQLNHQNLRQEHLN